MQVPTPDVQGTLAQFLLRVVWESSHLFKMTSSGFSGHSGCFLEMPTHREQNGSKAVVAGVSTGCWLPVPYSHWLSRCLAVTIASGGESTFSRIFFPSKHC